MLFLDASFFLQVASALNHCTTAMEGRRTSARTRRSIDGGVDGSLSLDVARVSTSTSPRSEQLLDVAKSKSRTSTRSARERAELAKVGELAHR